VGTYNAYKLANKSAVFGAPESEKSSEESIRQQRILYFIYQRHPRNLFDDPWAKHVDLILQTRYPILSLLTLASRKDDRI
jgi:hypothetical protein